MAYPGQIDPLISLAYQPTNLGIQTPMQSAQAVQQYQNLRSQNQLQLSQLAGEQQQQQQRQVAMDQNAALNSAISANTKQGDDGKYVTDDNGVMATLSGQGMGAVAMKYRSAQAELQQQLAQASDADLKHAGNMQDQVDSKLGQILGITDPEERESAWQDERQWAVDNKLADPNSLPLQAPSDQELQSMLMRSASGRQAIEVETQRRSAQAQAQRAAAADKQAQAAELRSEGYYDWMTNRSTRNWQKGPVTQDGYQTYFDNSGDTPKTFIDKSAKVTDPQQENAAERARHDQAMEDGRNNQQNGVTPNFQAKELDTARNQMDNVHRQRAAIGAALAVQNGKPYPDPKTGKESTQEMNEQIRAGLQTQYNNWTNEGYRLIDRYGDDKSNGRIGSNELPAQPSGAQPGPQPGAAASGGQPPAAAPKALPADPTGKSSFKMGQTLYKKDGTRIVVAGFDQNGNVIPAR